MLWKSFSVSSFLACSERTSDRRLGSESYTKPPEYGPPWKGCMMEKLTYNEDESEVVKLVMEVVNIALRKAEEPTVKAPLSSVRLLYQAKRAVQARMKHIEDAIELATGGDRRGTDFLGLMFGSQLRELRESEALLIRSIDFLTDQESRKER